MYIQSLGTRSTIPFNCFTYIVSSRCCQPVQNQPSNSIGTDHFIRLLVAVLCSRRHANFNSFYGYLGRRSRCSHQCSGSRSLKRHFHRFSNSDHCVISSDDVTPSCLAQASVPSPAEYPLSHPSVHCTRCRAWCHHCRNLTQMARKQASLTSNFNSFAWPSLRPTRK